MIAFHLFAILYLQMILAKAVIEVFSHLFDLIHYHFSELVRSSGVNDNLEHFL